MEVTFAGTERCAPPPRRWGLLALSLAAVGVVSIVGSLATDTGPASWYAGLDQPAWNPPDWLFAPVWTLLYVLMAVAAWLVARSGAPPRLVAVALSAYGVQLALNLAWTLVFFGLESAGGALVVIVVLVVAIAATMLAFSWVHPVPVLLLAPYLAWTLYAAALNASIVALN